MDLPSKNMYDTYKDEIWRELGPLDPDWFEALTAQTFINEGNVSDQDDLCANQEGNFKTPFDRTAVESQLFSTPKVFRQRRVVSPETEDEQSFTGEQEKETLPWTATQSPYLFRMSKEGVRGAKYGGFHPQSEDSFDLLHTPQKSPVSYAKHVSESLGAQIHSDMSWTSSLNTPPPSTLILSKTDESPCPVSLSDEKNVVLVRKLFPSLSNASRVGVVSPNKHDIPNVHQGVVSPEPGQNPESHDSPQSSLNQRDAVWKQTLPDAIEDGDIRRTVASVLGGAENVLSIFFTNSSSALRKVKTDRIKRKQIILTKEHDCSSADTSPTSSAASSEQRTADQAPGRLPSPPPVKTGEIGITQWSPLSLSEISRCTVDTSCHDKNPVKQVENNILTEQLRSDPGQPVRPPMKLTDSGFTKKKRQFVYTVKTSKTQVQGKETPSRKMDSSPGIPDFSGQEVNVKQLRKSPDEADCCSNWKNEMQKQGNLAEDNLLPSLRAKVQDLDMSQLCKDFAQDFSQISDPIKVSRIAEDTPQNGFSPSACLSALKQAKKKAVQANLHLDCDAVSNRRHVSNTNQNNPINEGTISDSGFQSAVVDGTRVTASSFVLPSSEINGQSQQWTGFKTDIHWTTPFTSTNKGNGEAHSDDILPEAEMHCRLSSTIKERQTLVPSRERKLHIESTSTQLPSNAKGTVDNINWIPLNGQVRGSLPEKTVYLPSVHALGFKRASNKGIHISSANLERAKRLLEETEEEMTLSDQPTKCAHVTKDEMSMSDGSVKNLATYSNQPFSSSEKNVDISCQLTASQKADVTELCTLLEEADSQFEFTQFKTAKLKQHCQDSATPSKEVDKELDPDFLSGIDFDDSFSSEAEKHLAVTVMHDKMALVSDGKPNCETSNVTSKSTGLSVSSAMKKENSSPEDVSFSSKHISEDSSRILSAEPKNLDRHGQTKTSHLENKNPLMLGGVGFKTAGGNVLKVSKKCLSKARALFADLEENRVTSQNPPDKHNSKTDAKTLHKHSVDNPTGDLLHRKKDNSKFTGDARERVQSCFSNAMESVCSDRQPRRDEDAIKTLKNSITDTTTRQRGFQMANGKGISVSAKAMQEVDAFFENCDAIGGNGGMSVKPKKSIPLPGSVSLKENLPKGKHVQGIKENLSEEPINEIENVNAGPVARHTEVVQHNVDSHNFGVKSTLALTNAASFRDNPSSTAKAHSSLSCTTSKSIGPPAIGELSNGGGFCLNRGKKVSTSADAMKKAEHLLNEIHTLDDANKQPKQKRDALRTGHLNNQIQVPPSKNGSFQMASGKQVAISSAALKKAKLLSECDKVEDKICVKPTDSKMAVPGPLSRNSGFLAASGKPVAFSSEALQKAKDLFSDISLSAEIPAVPDTRNSDKKQVNADNTEKKHCGFTTAGGAKVHVSQKNLFKAKNLLTELADGECHSNSYSTSPHDTHKSDLSKVKDVKRTLNCNLSPEEEMSSVLDCEINQTSSSEGSNVKRPQESSVVNFQSLNLSGCTETQQRFIAQEALDCTNALLEDESLAGQSLSMTLENVPLQENPKSSHRSVEEQKGTRKRSVEYPDVTGQPPLKRRLLEEFDRTVDGPRGSTLHPEKSFPNDIMKDRRVFKYSVSLHPNITRPHRNGNNYVETTLQKTKPTQQSTPEDSRSAHSKMPVFVPPFLKDAKTESHKNTVLKDNTKTPTSFVPPFKKQMTIVQESSSKPQVETPFNSNTYVPPTKKTQSNTDVTGNKIKEDIQTAASADTTNDNLLNNQNSPVSCGSEDSAAEASRVEDTVSTSQDMFQDLHNVELARDMQDMRIRKKKRQTIRPLPGSLFLTKTSGVSRIPLKAAVNGKPPARYTPKQLYGHGVHQHVCEITSETAESFRFNLQQFLKQEAFIDGGGVQLADGGLLIPSNDGTAGKEEFHRALCDTPGVDPKLISEGWVYNHYRWIVWKQASMERSFPETMGSLCLTPEQVLLQLKYRYDVEVDHSRRPALRKIMEKDDTSAKTLVLCVCGVVSRGQSPNRQSFSDTKTPQGADAKVENPSAVVMVTDGWYTIKAQLDEPLTAMLNKGRVAVGGKLIIHGAQLVGSQDACSPLEAPESLMLKICANSSRPTRWDAKLGFHRDPRPFLLPVSCLYSSGGPVGCVDIIILRSYPIQWMERKPDRGVVFRSVRAEEKEARRYNSIKQKAMEILYAKIQAEFEKEDKGNKSQHRRRTITRQEISSLQDGEELYEAVGNDPAYLEAHLSEEQLETLRAYRCSLMEKKQAVLQDRYRRALESAEDSEGVCPKREVTPVWRLCIADSMDQPGSVYQLNLWRPSSDLQSLVKEGCRYKVYNLTTSDGKKHGCSTTLQLTGTKKSQFQDLQASRELLATHFQPRVSTRFVDLQNPEFQPLCGEIDLTGYVISIVDGQGFSPAFYLTDGKLNFVKVRCFSSFAQAGLEDLVKPHVLLALSNLQLRGQSTSPTPVVYAGDLTLFSTNPKEVHLQESLSQLKNLIQGQENFLPMAEEKFSHLVKSDGLKSISSPALQTRTPASATVRRQDTKTSVTPQQPVRSLGAFTPVSRKPPAANCSSEKDPISLKRKRALDYLSRIPSPPPLSHLGSVASPCINKTFNPPRRSGTPSTLKTVQTPACKPVNSPVEDDWVNDEELAMIDTQALRVGDLL